MKALSPGSTPSAPHLRLRLGVALLVVLGAVPGVMASRPTAVVALPSAQGVLSQPAH